MHNREGEKKISPSKCKKGVTMITPNFYIKDGTYYERKNLYGLSTDTKPTIAANGSAFIEMDTSTIYFFDAENGEWLEWGGVSNE